MIQFLLGIVIIAILGIIFVVMSGLDTLTKKRGGTDVAMAKKAKRKKEPLTIDMFRITKRVLDKPYILELHMNAPLLVEVNDIPRSEPYTSSRGQLRITQHNGQLKLLLTEIQFLTLMLGKHDDAAVVIYAGSSPSHKLGILLEMFPNVKFILVDPNEHKIMYTRGNQYSDDAAASLLTYFKVAKGNRFGLSGRRVNVYGRGVVDRDGLDADALKYPSGLADILADDAATSRVCIIEDYMTNDLASTLAPLTRGTRPVYFVSDIRSYDEGTFPTNAHIIWNNIMHYAWLSRLNPAAFMIKYHPPYISNEPPKYEPYMMTDVDEYPVSAEKIHMDLAAGMYTYLAHDHMFLQSFAPQSSSEVRLVGSAVELTHYSVREFEDKLYYYNAIHRNVGNNRANKKYADTSCGIDTCADCALMCHILREYYVKYHGIDTRESVVDMVKRILASIEREIAPINKPHGMCASPIDAKSVTDIVADMYVRHAVINMSGSNYMRHKTAPDAYNQAYKNTALRYMTEKYGLDGDRLTIAAKALQTYDLFGPSDEFERDMTLALELAGLESKAAYRDLSARLKTWTRERGAVALPIEPAFTAVRSKRLDDVIAGHRAKKIIEINVMRAHSYCELHMPGKMVEHVVIYGAKTSEGGRGGDLVYRPTTHYAPGALIVLYPTCVSTTVMRFMYRSLVASNPDHTIIAISHADEYDGRGVMMVDGPLYVNSRHVEV